MLVWLPTPAWRTAFNAQVRSFVLSINLDRKIGVVKELSCFYFFCKRFSVRKSFCSMVRENDEHGDSFKCLRIIHTIFPRTYLSLTFTISKIVNTVKWLFSACLKKAPSFSYRWSSNCGWIRRAPACPAWTLFCRLFSFFPELEMFCVISYNLESLISFFCLVHSCI